MRNDSRRAGLSFSPSANLQYKGACWTRSIVSVARVFGALRGPYGHDFFYLLGIARKPLAEELVACFRDQNVVFDAHAKVFFRNVNAGLHRDHHAGLESAAVVAGIVDVQADVMTEAVDEILTEALAVKIFSMGIDVVVGDLEDAAVLGFAIQICPRPERSQSGILPP